MRVRRWGGKEMGRWEGLEGELLFGDKTDADLVAVFQFTAAAGDVAFSGLESREDGDLSVNFVTLADGASGDGGGFSIGYDEYSARLGLGGVGAFTL